MFGNILQHYNNVYYASIARHYSKAAAKSIGKRSSPSSVSSTPMKKPNSTPSSAASSAPSTPLRVGVAGVIGSPPHSKNLRLLSKAAVPTQRGKRSVPNPVCNDMSHSKRGDRFIQRHSCRKCMLKRFGELIENKNLHLWDIVQIIMREFRRCS